LELLRPDSAEQAVQALGNGTKALAGGTDLVPLLRERIVVAETLVDVGSVVPRGIQRGTPTSTSTSTSTNITIGAGTTLAELEVDSEIPEALREACRLAASPQLRAMGTIGGNLLQATRCWYWRLKFPCYLHGGDRCHAREGAHREHAIFGNERCASAHPSDIAAALLALGTTVRTTARELPIADLYRLPTEDDRDVTALGANELILELDVPVPEASAYLKAMDRRRWAFPLVGVAAARAEGGIRLALAGVAPIPWLIDSASALDHATPLPGTAYKVEVARALVRRALAGLDTGAR
jgi:xanthine dehydrogenase YagS FAD-binding subunit